VAFLGIHQPRGRRFAKDAEEVLERLGLPLSMAMRRYIRNIFGESGSARSRTFPSGTQYYFHLEGGEHYQDDLGTTFPTAERARKFAAALAAHLGKSNDWTGYRIAVLDEDQARIAELPIAS
jgi:hypothetical protein